jgi:hypothetical protein
MTELEIEQELDRIYDLEDMFAVEAWDEVNDELLTIDVETLDPTFIIAYIIVTRYVDQHLQARQPLINQFHKKYPKYKHIA